MCFYTWACTRALSWTQGTMFKPNMFRSNQRIWTHFSPLMGSVTMPEPNTILRIFSRLQNGLLLFYIGSICFILSIIQLKISQW